MYLNTRSRASSFIYQQAKKNKGAWLVPDNICHAVYVDIHSAGSQVNLIDIDRDTLELDTEKVWDQLQKGDVAGIIMVAAFGSTQTDHSHFFKAVKASYPEVYIIDDRCLCFPELEVEGSEADMLLFSTGYSKVVDLGFGGYSFTKTKLNPMHFEFSKSDADQFDSFFQRSIVEEEPLGKEVFDQVCKMHWLDHSQLEPSVYQEQIREKLDLVTEHKNNVNEVYGTIKSEFVIGEQFNNWRYNLLLENRDEILTRIFEQGLFASKHYYPLGRFFDLTYQSTWTDLYKGIINLFNDFRIEVEDAERIVKIVNDYGRTFDE